MRAVRRGRRCATYEVAGEAWIAERHFGIAAFVKHQISWSPNRFSNAGVGS